MDDDAHAEPALMGIRDDAAGLRQLLQCVVQEGQTQLEALEALEAASP